MEKPLSSIFFYHVFLHNKRLKYDSIFTSLVIIKGTHNPLILIIFERYHKPEGSSVLSSEYNRIPCIFHHCRISLNGHMFAKIQHLIRLYCINSIHHFFRSNNDVLHRLIFKLVIMNSFLLRGLLFLAKQNFDLAAGSLFELWGIGTKCTKATLLATTQNGTRSSIMPLSQYYCSDCMYNLKCLQGRFATDTFYADTKYFNGKTVVKYIHIKFGSLLANPCLI